MKAYLAHCMADYGTEIESKVLALLKHMGFEVTNPGDIKFQSTCVRNSMSYWTGLVGECKALFFFKYKEQVPAGVAKEISRALDDGLEVFELIVENGEITAFQRREEVPPHLSVAETRKLLGRTLTKEDLCEMCGKEPKAENLRFCYGCDTRVMYSLTMS